MKKQLDTVVRKILDDVEFAEVLDYPEFVDLEFSVDIMEPGDLVEGEPGGSCCDLLVVVCLCMSLYVFVVFVVVLFLELLL